MVGDPGATPRLLLRRVGAEGGDWDLHFSLPVCGPQLERPTSPSGRRGPSRPWPLLCEGGGEHSRAAVLVTPRPSAAPDPEGPVPGE